LLKSKYRAFEIQDDKVSETLVDGNLIALADFIKNCKEGSIITIHTMEGVKIIEGSNGLFVSMPSYKVGNEYKDICFPITPECRKQLNDAVLGAYEQALTQSQNSMAKHHEMQQAPEGQVMDMTGM